MRTSVETHGRLVELVVQDDVDDFGQFGVCVFVDGTERFGAFFTDRSEEEAEAR